MSGATARILRLGDLVQQPRALAAIDEIFFASSATQVFADEDARAAFRERWLGRHLVHHPGESFVAVDGSGEVIGYVVGALGDPAQDPRFADISYFRELAHLTARYPAHLHINLAPGARNRGIGSRLVAAFCVHAAARGATGVHVVTAEASRNRSFYARNGFALLTTLGAPGREIVMLGRRLPAG